MLNNKTFHQNYVQASPVIRWLLSANLLIHIAKNGQDEYFPCKNGTFICELKILGPKWLNVSTANNEGKLYSNFFLISYELRFFSNPRLLRIQNASCKHFKIHCNNCITKQGCKIQKEKIVEIKKIKLEDELKKI